MKDYEYLDEFDRDYWEQYDYYWEMYESENHRGGGKKSVLPIVLYVVLVLVMTPFGGALPVSVFGLVPVFVYYRF